MEQTPAALKPLGKTEDRHDVNRDVHVRLALLAAT
jgi:hypothetical protein